MLFFKNMNFLILKSAAKADFFLCTQVLCTYPSFTFFKVPMFVTTRTQAARFLGIFPLKKANIVHGKGPVGGIFFYPMAMQDRVVELGLTTKDKIQLQLQCN